MVEVLSVSTRFENKFENLKRVDLGKIGDKGAEGVGIRRGIVEDVVEFRPEMVKIWVHCVIAIIDLF